MTQPIERRAYDPWRAEMQERITGLENKLDENTKLTRELKDILETLRGGWKFLGWLGNALKFWLGIAAAAAAAWAAFWPHGPK